MTMEDRLERLAARKVPEPREDARDTALAAAMQAFDAAAGKNAAATQGTAEPRRLTTIANRLWETLMSQKLMTTSALATLMILPVAGYVGYSILQDAGPSPVLIEDASRQQAGGLLPLDGSSDEEPVAESVAPAPAPTLRSKSLAPSGQTGFSSGGGIAQLGSGNSVAVPNSVPAMESRKFGAFQDNGGLPAAEADRVTQLPGVVRPEDMPVADADKGDRVEKTETNSVISVKEQPVSTFSADVDTASYAMVRRAITQGYLPDPATVRVEELVNYFPYDYAGPDSADTPFKATVTVTPNPWNSDTQLLHVAVKGYDIKPAAQPAANLVFLIDTSGSMQAQDKLPLLKSAFRLLVDKLQPEDTVSIVTYAGSAGTVLEPTKASDKRAILDALERLDAGGSTAGAAGIEEAYRLAEKAFVKDGVNRVMLATDGDFNVGPSSDDALKRMIEEKRKSGVFLSVFGFGEGNYNDQLMQVLAQNGNGVAAYIDTLAEAEKTLVQEATSSLFPIASDVKFQIEFNPAVIAEYRQIGFETRVLKREDFNNDRIDAGDIGSGHTVTAIYEITPVGSPAILNSDLRYGGKEEAAAGNTDEIAFLKMRAKVPGESQSGLTEIAVTRAAMLPTFEAAADDVRFSVAVAAFGQKLRGTPQVDGFGYDEIGQVAAGARGEDPYGYRGEFLKLVRLAEALSK